MSSHEGHAVRTVRASLPVGVDPKQVTLAVLEPYAGGTLIGVAMMTPELLAHPELVGDAVIAARNSALSQAPKIVAGATAEPQVTVRETLVPSRERVAKFAPLIESLEGAIGTAAENAPWVRGMNRLLELWLAGPAQRSSEQEDDAVFAAVRRCVGDAALS